jgi:hypothetical protein
MRTLSRYLPAATLIVSPLDAWPTARLTEPHGVALAVHGFPASFPLLATNRSDARTEGDQTRTAIAVARIEVSRRSIFSSFASRRRRPHTLAQRVCFAYVHIPVEADKRILAVRASPHRATHLPAPIGVRRSTTSPLTTLARRC